MRAFEGMLRLSVEVLWIEVLLWILLYFSLYFLSLLASKESFVNRRLVLLDQGVLHLLPVTAVDTERLDWSVVHHSDWTAMHLAWLYRSRIVLLIVPIGIQLSSFGGLIISGTVWDQRRGFWYVVRSLLRLWISRLSSLPERLSLISIYLSLRVVQSKVNCHGRRFTIHIITLTPCILIVWWPFDGIQIRISLQHWSFDLLIDFVLVKIIFFLYNLISVLFFELSFVEANSFEMSVPPALSPIWFFSDLWTCLILAIRRVIWRVVWGLVITFLHLGGLFEFALGHLLLDGGRSDVAGSIGSWLLPVTGIILGIGGLKIALVLLPVIFWPVYRGISNILSWINSSRCNYLV